MKVSEKKRPKQSKVENEIDRYGKFQTISRKRSRFGRSISIAAYSAKH
jgi:hypothetical protein